MNCSKLLRSLFATAILATLSTLDAAPIGGFANIENWTGSGSNQSALIIQWNFTDGVTTTSVAYAWGYRWNSGGTTPTGWDMLTSISAADPWLQVIPLDDYSGYEAMTAAAFGIFYTNNGQASLASPGAPGVPDYAVPANTIPDTPGATTGTGGLYQSGWASSGYWSYNYAVTPSENYPGIDAAGRTYSLTGAAGRDLTDDSWDIWSFDVEFAYPEPSFVTPLAAVPEPATSGLLAGSVLVIGLLRKRTRR